MYIRIHRVAEWEFLSDRLTVWLRRVFPGYTWKYHGDIGCGNNIALKIWQKQKVTTCSNIAKIKKKKRNNRTKEQAIIWRSFVNEISNNKINKQYNICSWFSKSCNLSRQWLKTDYLYTRSIFKVIKYLQFYCGIFTIFLFFLSGSKPSKRHKQIIFIL